MLKNANEYGRIFNCDCSRWTVDVEQNVDYLRFTEKHLLKILEFEDLTLNTVYKVLGFKTDDKYKKVGWKRNENVMRFSLFELFGPMYHGYDILIEFLGLEDLSNDD